MTNNDVARIGKLVAAKIKPHRQLIESQEVGTHVQLVCFLLELENHHGNHKKLY